MEGNNNNNGGKKEGDNTELRILELKNRLEPNTSANIQRKQLDEMVNADSNELEDEDATEFFEIEQTDIQLTTTDILPKEPTITKTNSEVNSSAEINKQLSDELLTEVNKTDEPTITVTKTKTELTQLKDHGKRLPSKPDAFDSEDEDHTELATQIGIELESELPQADPIPESEDVTQMTQLDLDDEDGEYEYEEVEEDESYTSFGYIDEKKSKLKEEEDEEEENFPSTHPLKRIIGGLIEIGAFVGFSILGDKEQIIIQTEKVYYFITEKLQNPPNLSDQQLDLLLMALFGIISISLVNLLCLFAFQRSLGKVITNTKILRLDNNEPSLLNLLAREFLLKPLSYLLLVGFITLFTDEQNRSLHDKISYTKVVDRD